MLAPVSFPLPLNNSKHSGYVSGSDLHINLSPGMGEVDARSKESKSQEPAPHHQTRYTRPVPGFGVGVPEPLRTPM